MVYELDRQMLTNDLHKNINLMKIDYIYKCNTLGVVNEMVSDQWPAIFKMFFKIIETSHDSRTLDQLIILLMRLFRWQHAVRVKEACLKK